MFFNHSRFFVRRCCSFKPIDCLLYCNLHVNNLFSAQLIEIEPSHKPGVKITCLSWPVTCLVFIEKSWAKCITNYSNSRNVSRSRKWKTVDKDHTRKIGYHTQRSMKRTPKKVMIEKYILWTKVVSQSTDKCNGINEILRNISAAKKTFTKGLTISNTFFQISCSLQGRGHYKAKSYKTE